MAITKISPDVVDFDAGITISTADNLDTLTLTSTDADANSGPNLRLYRNSSSPADNDALGFVEWEGRNDNSQDVIYGQIGYYATDVSDGTEDSNLYINTIVGGTVRNRINAYNNEVVINEESIDSDFRVESDGNANMLFVDGGNNRVGIGEGSPDTLLMITGDAAALTIEDNGSYSADSVSSFIAFNGQDAAGSNRDLAYINVGQHAGGNGTGSIDFQTRIAGTVASRLKIDSAGRVGIGATPKSWVSTWEVLQVGSRAAVTSQNGDVLQLSENTYNDGSSWKAVVNAASSLVYLDNGSTQFYHAPSVSADANQSFSEKMRVTADGLTFNGDTAAANALDDYEEATWSPAITTGSATFSNARVTKVGRLVHFSFQMQALNDITTNASIIVTGLPFAVAVSQAAGSALGTYTDNGTANVVYATDSEAVYFYKFSSGSWDTMTHANLNSTSNYFYVSGSYHSTT